MKPSERVQEIFGELSRKNPLSEVNAVRAIVQYLDEQYEKNKPCEHLETEHELLYGQKVCKNANL